MDFLYLLRQFFCASEQKFFFSELQFIFHLCSWFDSITVAFYFWCQTQRLNFTELSLLRKLLFSLGLWRVLQARRAIFDWFCYLRNFTVNQTNNKYFSIFMKNEPILTYLIIAPPINFFFFIFSFCLLNLAPCLLNLSPVCDFPTLKKCRYFWH